MNILSLHSGGHDAAAALFRDYDMVSAVQLERLTRVKGDGNCFPELAIDEVLAIAGQNRKDIDVILLSRMGFSADHFTHWPFYKKIEYKLTRRRKDMAGELHRLGITDAGAIFNSSKFLRDHGFRDDAEVGFYNHHLGHALSALAYTDWDNALLYTADGGGDNVHWSQRIFNDGTITDIFGGEEELVKPQRVDSIGLAYGYATEAIGFRINRHEGKLTGLAAYGQPVLADEIGKHFFIDSMGIINSDFTSNAHMRETIHNLAATHIKQSVLKNGDEMSAKADVAASIQQVLESKVLQSVKLLIDAHGVRNLGLAGGVFANVRLNRLLCENTDIDEIFIFPGMGDEGITVGGVHQYLIEKRGMDEWLKHRTRLNNVYLGRNYDGEISDVLQASDGVEHISTSAADAAASLLAANWVGAIYKGRMEFGPRALGARSILASPADTNVNHTINERLQRTEFMPFAPYVLEEDASIVFDITTANRYAARFMTITCDVKPEWHDRIPAVVHVDGTARPQIISRKDNPLYADILTAFKKKTGLPVLVNTSFNAHEEPIINKPEECLKALIDCRVDFIVCETGIYATTEKAGSLKNDL